MKLRVVTNATGTQLLDGETGAPLPLPVSSVSLAANTRAAGSLSNALLFVEHVELDAAATLSPTALKELRAWIDRQPELAS